MAVDEVVEKICKFEAVGIHEMRNICFVIHRICNSLKAECPPFVKALKPKKEACPLTDIKAYILPSAKRKYLIHTAADWTLLSHDFKNLLTEVHKSILIGSIKALAFFYQRKRLTPPNNKPARLLAAKTKTYLRSLAEISTETGMVGADLANGILAKFQNDLTEIILIEKRAALILGKNKMGLISPAYASSELISQLARNGLKTLCAFLVNINLPANAAAMATLRCNAFEIFIIFGVYFYHSVSPHY